MTKILEMLGLMPKAMQIAIVGILLGGVGFAAHEQRYMTVDQFTKSYVLDLRSAIRDIQSDLMRPDLNPEVRSILLEQLAVLVDELCYELPSDPYCQSRK